MTRSRRRRGPHRAADVSGSDARDLRILKEIAEALNGAPDVDEALQTTLERVATLLGLETGWIWLADAQTGQFYSAVAQRLPPFLREPVRMTGRSCWCLDAYRAGYLAAGNIDVMECSRLRAAVADADRAHTEGLRYHASVPLYFGTRPLGIMNVAAPAWRKLTPRELDLLSTIASQVGVAIERARLARENVRVARAEERGRVARQIHDTLAQRLTAIGLHLEAALDAMPSGGRQRQAADQLQRALALSKASLDEARAAMRELRTPGNGRPLPEALSALAHAFSAETGIRVHLRTDGRSTSSPSQEEDLYGIVNEALTNVRKHAHATDVDVSFEAVRGRIRLEVADNGSGFSTRARTSGFGLTGMRERADALGGHLRVVSSIGRGTRIIVTVPQATA
jgi:two-component system, NarL family, sensor kinase